MEYNKVMAKDVSFVLDQKGGEQILTKMSRMIVKQSAEAIASRARSMAGSMTSNPPDIDVTSTVGTIRRGVRAITTISASGQDAHANYVGYQALRKAKDAGRI